MIIEQIPIGPMANFGYILGCEETRIAALIDPAFEPEKLIARAKELDLDIEWILNTHGKVDPVTYVKPRSYNHVWFESFQIPYNFSRTVNIF